MCDIKTICDSQRQVYDAHRVGRSTSKNSKILPSAADISAMGPTLSADMAALQARWVALALQDDDDTPKTSPKSAPKSLNASERNVDPTRTSTHVPTTDVEQDDHDAELDSYLLGQVQGRNQEDGKSSSTILSENVHATTEEKKDYNALKTTSQAHFSEFMTSPAKVKEDQSWWEQARARAIKRKQDKELEAKAEDEYKISLQRDHDNVPVLKLDETWRASHESASTTTTTTRLGPPVVATEIKEKKHQDDDVVKDVVDDGNAKSISTPFSLPAPLFQSPESKRILKKIVMAKAMSPDDHNADELMEYGTIKQRQINSSLSKKAIRTLLNLDTNAIDDQDNETTAATIPAAISRAKRSEKNASASASSAPKNPIMGRNQGLVAFQLKEKLRLKKEINSLTRELVDKTAGSSSVDRDAKSPSALPCVDATTSVSSSPSLSSGALQDARATNKGKGKSKNKSKKKTSTEKFQTRVGDDSIAFRSPMVVHRAPGQPDVIDQRQTYFYAIQKRLLMPDLMTYITSSCKDAHENHTRMVWALERAIKNWQTASDRDCNAASERIECVKGYKAKYLAQCIFYKKLHAYYEGHWIKMKQDFQRVRMRLSSTQNDICNKTLDVPTKTILLSCHLYVGNEQVGPPSLDGHQLVTDTFMQKMYNAFRIGSCTIDPLTLVDNSSSNNNYFTYNPYERLFFQPFVAIYIGSGGTGELGVGLSMDMRNVTSRYFSNSIPTNEAVNTILDAAKGRTLVHLNSGSGYWAYVCRQAFAIRQRRYRDLVQQSREDVKKTRVERANHVFQAIEKLKAINNTYSAALIDQITRQAKKVDEESEENNALYDTDDSDVPTNYAVNELIKSQGADHEHGKIIGTWFPTMHTGTILSFCESPKAKNTVLVFNWPKMETASQVLKCILACKTDTIVYIGPAQDPDPNAYMEYLDVVHMVVDNVFPWDSEPDLVKRKKLRQRYRQDVDNIVKQSWKCSTAVSLPKWPGLTSVGDCLYVLTRTLVDDTVDAVAV